MTLFRSRHFSINSNLYGMMELLLLLFIRSGRLTRSGDRDLYPYQEIGSVDYISRETITLTQNLSALHGTDAEL